MSGLALFTTAYSAGLPYFAAFHASLAAQTDQEFDLHIALDNVTEAQLRELATAPWHAAGHNVVTSPKRVGANPIELRQELLTLLCGSYDAVVLADSDDELLPTRVASARAALAVAPFSACAMKLIDEDGKELAGQFSAGAVDDWWELVAHMNVFGFGNAAYRSELLEACLPVAPRTRLMDWQVVTHALATGALPNFEQEPQINYRLHPGSMAPVVGPFDEEQLRRGAKLVREHRQLLLQANRAGPLLPGELEELIRLAQGDLERFTTEVLGNPKVLNSYVTALNTGTQVYKWWEWVDDRRLRELWNA